MLGFPLAAASGGICPAVTVPVSRRASRVAAATLALAACFAVVRAGTAPAVAWAASTAVAACGEADALVAGESLPVGTSLVSASGRYRLTLHRNGNLVLYDSHGLHSIGVLDKRGIESLPVTSSALWSSNSADTRDAQLTMRADGDLVLHGVDGARTSPRWRSRTAGSPGALLRVCDDGTVTVSDAEGRVLWTAGSSTPTVGPAGLRHVVYGRSAQRVWLIAADGRLFDTYPVSGRLTNPIPGLYSVYSKSATATGFGGGVTMAHMVRFAHGVNGFRIGFHAIPRDWDGQPIQSVGQLGEALSAGCVRQQDSKARQLYDWTPIGTPVIVVQ